MHCIHVEKSSPLSYKYRYTQDDLEPWKTVNLRPKRAGRPSDSGRIELPPLYDGPRDAKYRDLQDLLCYVPPVYHSFCTGLVSESSTHANADEGADEDE